MAGSLKLFTCIQKYYHVIGIYPPASHQNDKPSINSRNWICIIAFVLLALSSAAFFVVEAKSMLDYGLSCLATSAAVLPMGVYLVVVGQMKNTLAFIENCERFIEKREHTIGAYRELIEKIERLCKLAMSAMITSILFGTLPFSLYSLTNYFIFDLGEESFFLLFPPTWPFNWKTPLGYFVAWLAQTAGCAAIALTTIIFINLILGSCWLFLFTADDITKDLVAFNLDAKTNEIRVECTKRFCDIVQLYSDAKQCVNEFNAIVKYSLFIYIFFLMLSVSSTLLTLQFLFLDENAKLFETFMVSITALWIFGALLLICELGERMTYHFKTFDDALEQCDWYTQRIEWQQMYLIFLSDTQQPKYIKCYGNILCVRDTFKKITKTGFSYFVTLRHFEI